MAIVEGTQDIPSADIKKYQAAFTRKTTTDHVRIRMPFQLPKAKAGGPHESPKRAAQRARFSSAKDYFNTLDASDRSDWYDSAPIWNSYLWYYNWFILAGLNGVSGVPGKADVVIKSINHYTFTLPTGAPANITVSISSINPAKGMAFFYGAGYKIDGIDTVYFAAANYPHLVSLASTNAIIQGSIYNDAAAACGLTIIEYI